jgi:hypothetical protein
VNSGIMSTAMRASAASGFTPSGLPMVSGGENDAKHAAMDSTVAMFANFSLPFIAPTPPPTIPQPSQQNVPLLPGGTASASTPPSMPSGGGPVPSPVPSSVPHCRPPVR